jgi:hypothetical protein
MSTVIQHPSSRRLVIATVLLTPGALFVTANVLQYGLGLDGAADWFDPLFALPAVAWILTAFAGHLIAENLACMIGIRSTC